MFFNALKKWAFEGRLSCAPFWCSFILIRSILVHFSLKAFAVIIGFLRISPSMHLILKYFPEITLKSRVVRERLTRQLRDNLRVLLRPIVPSVKVAKEWDKMTIDMGDHAPECAAEAIEVLKNTPGIAYFVVVEPQIFQDIDELVAPTLKYWAPLLADKTFVVRVKRSGKHNFTSTDVERQLGSALMQCSGARGVKMKGADETVYVEIFDDVANIVTRRYQGLGGFPVGTVESVVSLISGGFDSTVSTYQLMRRGVRTHFCFFNLGGRAHELAVKEVAQFLWRKYGASHGVRFVTIPFEGVVAELLEKVNDRYMGVILKRMMVRVGSAMAERLHSNAIVTGEAIAQVSSQTLTNLAVIDKASDAMVLRPLIGMDKEQIIQIADAIGTADFARHIPEYCGVISVRPKTKAKLGRVEVEEANFDFSVLQAAIDAADVTHVHDIDLAALVVPDIEVMTAPIAGSVIIDIRTDDEVDNKPLRVPGFNVVHVPFYRLRTAMADMAADKTYMLYCDKGVMSNLQATHLFEAGYRNIKVYRPSVG